MQQVQNEPGNSAPVVDAVEGIDQDAEEGGFLCEEEDMNTEGLSVEDRLMKHGESKEKHFPLSHSRISCESGKARSIRLARQRQEEVQREQKSRFAPTINQESKRLVAESSRSKERKEQKIGVVESLMKRQHEAKRRTRKLQEEQVVLRCAQI